MSFTNAQTIESMKLSFFLVLLSASCYVWGQSVPRQVLATEGGSSLTESMMVSWTLGEMTTTTGEHQNGYYTQGFHQPQIEVKAIDTQGDDPFAATLFPNPTKGLLEVQVENQTHLFQINLYDVSGRLLWAKKTASPVEQIDLSNLPSAQYLLKIDIPDLKTVRTFQVTKIW